ncbi:unnamed protein product [Hymenolepis diminuta]|uniref:Uncharacterized protein n=1 Tax=Hymenolepis diminuta TaxID=6216 RepID=A0A564XUR6_HYMDI|nr:unnamed protein product [Hymenolepis diminuta]
MKNVSEFDYEHSVGGTFAALYARNRGVSENEMAGLPNERRINKRFGKFSKRERDVNLDCHLPPSPKDLTFEERIKKRFGCLNLAIGKGADIHIYTVFVIGMRNEFLFGWLKEDQFRCLVIDRGLRSPLYAKIRLKLFSLFLSCQETRNRPIAAATAATTASKKAHLSH